MSEYIKTSTVKETATQIIRDLSGKTKSVRLKEIRGRHCIFIGQETSTKHYGTSWQAALLKLRQNIYQNMSTPLNDESKMPFGEHKGKEMGKVPASYLLWLWDNGVWQETGRPLHNYIKDALSALETECKDYILQHPLKKS